MKKFFSFFAAVLFAGSMMADNFVPVTDASTLADGDQIIITDVNAAAAISTTQNNNNRGVAEVALTDGVIVPGENVQIITLVAAEANFMLQVGEDAYLYAASNSSNHLKTAAAATVGDNGKFAISIDGTGVASVTAQGTNGRNDLRYNPSGMFSCYGSSSSIEAGLKIFKKEEGGGETPVEPEMAYYVNGTMTQWAVSEDYKLVANTEAVGEEYMGVFTFAANDEFKVVYSDGETTESTNYFPQGMDNNYVVSAAGEYTVYFRPAGDMTGVEGWHYGCIYMEEYVEPEVPVYTCAQVQANEASVEGFLNEVTVMWIKNKNIFVRDLSGMTQVYFENSGLQVGDIVSGIKGTSTMYQTTPEFVPSNAPADWTIVNGEAPVYDEKEVAATTSDVNGVYKFMNVTFAEAVEFTTESATNVTVTIGEGTNTLRNNYKLAYTFEAEKAYNIVALVSIYQNNPQLYFISAEEVEETPVSEWTEISFAEAVAASDLAANAEFEFGGLKVAIADTENKMAIDGNNANFGTAESYVPYAFRLKSGGKSLDGEKKNYMEITVPANGELRLAVRAGNGTDTTRTLVLVQGGDTIYNAIVKDADAIVVPVTDSTTTKVYPYVYVPVTAGVIRVSYPVNGLNFYNFAFKAAAEPIEPTEEFYLVGNFNGWQVSEAYQLVVNPANEAEMMIAGVELAAEDSLKVIGINGEIVTWYPAGDETHNYVVTDTAMYDIYFRADGQGGEGWHEGYIYLVVSEPVVLEPISLTQFITDKPAEEVLLKDLTVIYATNKSTYVIDEDGVALVMYDASKTYYDGTLTAGTVLSGQKATYTLYNNQAEIIPTNTAETSVGVAPVAVVMEAKPSVEANENQYLHFDSVQVTENGGKFYIYADVLLYGASSDLKPAEAGDYNMEGIFINYKGNTPELIITALEKIETPVVPGDTIVLDFSGAFAYVDNTYFEEFGSTDIVFTTIPLNEEYDLVGDGDFLQIEVYPENPNDITGLYTIEAENLDDYYTYLMRVNGTDTAEIDFVDGTVAIEVLAVDEESMLAQLSLNAYLLGNDNNTYVVEGTFVLLYDFLEDEPIEAVENTEAAAKVIKRIEMGNVVIYKNGEKYSVMGAKL